MILLLTKILLMSIKKKYHPIFTPIGSLKNNYIKIEKSVKKTEILCFTYLLLDQLCMSF